jgi:hypothetical protein
MEDKIEEKAVELAELKAGVKLRAGHRVVFLVNGVKGTPRRAGADDGWAESKEDPNGGGAEPAGGETP